MSKFLLVKSKAGLGNALLSVLGGILYSHVTSRALYIDWLGPGSTDRVNYFPLLFSRPQLVDPTPIWRSKRVAPAIWTGHLQESVDELLPRYETDVEADSDPNIARKYTIDIARSDYMEDVLVRWAWTHELYRMRRHFRGQFASLRTLTEEEILRKLVHDELALVPGIQSLVDEFRSREFADITIGLHIRYSDRKNSFDQYPLLIDRVLHKHPGAAVFLATDNKEVETLFRKRYPTLVVRAKWYAQPGTPLHRTRSCPDPFALTVDAIVEMWLLGQCQYLIYNSTSTFAVLASLVSGAPRNAVFDTSPWKIKGRDWVVQRIRELRLRFSLGNIR